MDARSPALIDVPVADRDRLRIGMLWGDFPWAVPPPKIGTLWSSGVVARNVTRALNTLGRVVPFTPPQAPVSPHMQRKLLTDFLRSIDLFWADLYPGSAEVLSLRHDLGLDSDCPALLYAGNELGGRLQAAESVMHLVRVLIAVEHRRSPCHDRLVSQLDTLDAQDWPPGYLRHVLLQLVQTGNPRVQQELELRVETLLRTRGFAVNVWEGEIDRVKAFRFD